MNIVAENIIEILKIGLSGFAFLMMWLSYLLLKAEQKREQDPRPGFIKAIYVFMALSFSFAVLVASYAAFELIRDLDHEQFQEQVAKCRDELGELQSISMMEDQSVNNLQAAIIRAVGQCDTLLIDLDSATP